MYASVKEQESTATTPKLH